MTSAHVVRSIHISSTSQQREIDMKQIILYEIREYKGNEYSKQLGRRLRTRSEASRIVKILKADGREVFASKIKVFA